MIKQHITPLAIIVFLLAIISGCAELPTKQTGVLSVPEPYGEGVLGEVFSSPEGTGEDESGFILLRDGKQALRERLNLIEISERNIDMQYYIWNSDQSGRLLMQQLFIAAERGIKVRLLLDDFSVGDRNDQLLAINSHPNIEVRIHNPFMVRSGMGKWLNFSLDFDRLNHRMHNKTFTVDSVVTITGGRNIGDEYFDYNEQINFDDVDLLSVGPVVQQVSKSFIDYWNSPWAVPVEQLLEDDSKPDETATQEFISDDIASFLDEPPQDPFLLQSHFYKLKNELIWAPAEFVADEPGGTEGGAFGDGPKRVALRLVELAAESEQDILIESAYFVLNDEALEVARQLSDKGVTIRALTNSMSSNDVLPNHSSYAMVREDMLDSGIELYELRPDAESCPELIGNAAYCDEDSYLGLHAKTAVFDNEIVYVGSMNLNLRSAYLNTEAAMIVKSPILALELSEQIELNMKPENCWKVLKKDGDLIWVTTRKGVEETSDNEPLTSWLERFEKGFLELVPGAEYY